MNSFYWVAFNSSNSRKGRKRPDKVTDAIELPPFVRHLSGVRFSALLVIDCVVGHARLLVVVEVIISYIRYSIVR